MRLPRVRYVSILGAYLPSTIVGLVALTLGASVLAALVQRPAGSPLAAAASPLADATALVPALVFEGHLWRLVTWTFFELDALNLIFACLLLAMLGRDLSGAWGHWRFVGLYVGFASTVGIAICVLSLVWQPLESMGHLTAWAMVDAILIAWAIQFPNRQILVFFVIPAAGRNLIYLTVAGAALFAVFGGRPIRFLPHFLAMGFIFAWMRHSSLNLAWLRLRLAMMSPRLRRDKNLRAVPRQGDEPPRWLH